MQSSRTRLTLAPLALAVAMALGAAPLAHAAASADTLVELTIAAQPLSQALGELARKTGTTFVAAPALLANKQAPALSGRLSLRQALDRLLAGSGLLAHIDNNAITLTPAPKPGAESLLQEVTVNAKADPSTEGSGSYTARALTIGKGVQSLRETPQSVTVVTRQRLDDQNLQTVGEVMLQTTGVTAQERNFGHLTYNARGFSIGNYQVDGVPRGEYGGIGIAPDLAVFDRVEVLRGAPGVLIGNGDPSGTVNFVRKRPTAEKQLDIIARAGRWNTWRLDVDAAGPLNADGSVRGRVVASHGERDSYFKHTSIDTPLLYGILEADLSKDTMLTVGARTQSYHQKGGRLIGGLPQSADGSDLQLPRDTTLAPAWTGMDTQAHEGFGELLHRFNDDWQFKLSGSYSRSFRQDVAARRAGYVNPASMTGVSVNAVAYGDDDFRSGGVDGQLTGKFNAFGRQHGLVVGANWEREETNSRSARVNFSPVLPINFNNYSVDSLVAPARPPFPATYRTLINTHGLYGNVKLNLTDPLSLMLGGRLSWYESSQVLLPDNVSSYAYKQSHELTPFVAAIYKLNQDWSLYGSYTDIFQSQSTNFTASGQPLAPAIGKNYEAGVKGELFDGKLNASLAVFHITQTGLAATDPSSPLDCPGTPAAGGCSINGGKVKSDGFEAELSGELLKNLQVSAGYTYNNAKNVINRDADGKPTLQEGRPYGADYNPRHLLRVWSSWKPSGALAGYTFGGGVSLQSKLSDLDQYAPAGIVPRIQGGYAVWNAMASYRIASNLSATLNVANLFDKRYFQGSWQSYYGSPRNVTLTLRAQY
ncbi:TonB-dependent receptor [Duganella sp. sic0402]|uniref:TonB-dependent siderophore receptor n=1 Tax=Duganella sp. sic0402 TaxID=2854786 RepID=UPI001C472FCB|nr:TonB-dependent receptor [Duganella sp. sic0402]MBV7536599.1 TonB-dependent receptor [Duganella sp. sic0402]